jgi:hypothetical protein
LNHTLWRTELVRSDYRLYSKDSKVRQLPLVGRTDLQWEPINDLDEILYLLDYLGKAAAKIH